MKITQQLIAAASFASLLFAPLAQAQTSATGNVELTVLGSSLSIRADDLNFGSVASASDANDLVVACTSTSAGTASIKDGSGEITGTATCGVITVTGGTGSNTYTLSVQIPTDLTNGSSNTIRPTFTVYDSSGANAIAGLETVTTSSSETSATNALPIAARVVHTYKLGGTAPIGENQATGVYRGTYIVQAVVV